MELKMAIVCYEYEQGHWLNQPTGYSLQQKESQGKPKQLSYTVCESESMARLATPLPNFGGLIVFGAMINLD